MQFRRCLTVILLFVLVFGVTISVKAQSSVTVTTKDNAQLRSGPGRQFSSFGTVPFSTTMPATGRNDDDSWIQVNYNGTTGWIVTYLLNWSGNLDSLPVGGQAASAPAAQPVPAGALSATNASVLNVRSGPSTSSARLGQLPAGTTIGLNGRWGSGSGLWVRFDFNGQEGWAAGWLLNINGDPNALPDVQAAQNAVLGLCTSGGSAPEATPYTAGPGLHPVLLLDENGNRHPWSSLLGSWAASTGGAAELVACVGAQQSVNIETCYYIGPNIDRYIYQISVRLIVAQTGQVLSSTTLSGDSPRECRPTEPYSLTRLDGPAVSFAQLQAWLQPFVNP